MRKILVLLATMIGMASVALGQVTYNTVSATVTDSNGNPYANAALTANLVNAQGYPVSSATTPNGQLFNAKQVLATLDATGHFSIELVPNNILSKPSGTKWAIAITAPTDTSILLYQPPWTLNYQVSVTADVSLSSQLSALTVPVAFVNLKTGQSSISAQDSTARAAAAAAQASANSALSGSANDSTARSAASAAQSTANSAQSTANAALPANGCTSTAGGNISCPGTVAVGAILLVPASPAIVSALAFCTNYNGGYISINCPINTTIFPTFGGYHAIHIGNAVDFTGIVSPDNAALASIDTQSVFSGSANYNHILDHQKRDQYNGSGGISEGTNPRWFADEISHVVGPAAAGNIPKYGGYLYHDLNVQTGSTATFGTQCAICIDSLITGDTNYAFFSAGKGLVVANDTAWFNTNLIVSSSGGYAKFLGPAGFGMTTVPTHTADFNMAPGNIIAFYPSANPSGGTGFHSFTMNFDGSTDAGNYMRFDVSTHTGSQVHPFYIYGDSTALLTGSFTTQGQLISDQGAVVNAAGSDSVGVGGNFTLHSAGHDWVQQLGASSDLAFWHYYSGGWTKPLDIADNGNVSIHGALCFGSANVCDVVGAGVPAGANCSATPNGVTTFALGSTYRNISGGAGSTLYVCEVAGSWAAK